MSDERHEQFASLARRLPTAEPDAILSLCDEAHASGDERMRVFNATGLVGNLACERGCSWCCHYKVTISWPEAFRLAAFVAEWAEAERDAVVEHLRDAVPKTQGLDAQVHAQLRIPCALLRDGACSAYAVRPLPCRAATAFDASRCEASLSSDGPSWETSPFGLLAYDPPLDGIVAGLREAGLEATTELGAGLLHALTADDALESWRRAASP